MARPHRRVGRRTLAVLAAGATAVSGTALLGPGTSSASSHREAPYVLSDPAIDNTDVYAFVSPDNPDTVTLIANFYPFQKPDGGPNFYPFATDARYNINIDNDHDAKPDVTFRFNFENIDRRGTASHGTKVPGTFLYNDGPVTSLDDENLLFRQTYDLQVVTAASGGTPATATLLDNAPVPPDNVGVASIPDYVPLRNAALEAGRVTSGSFNGVRAFAGQRDDSFFLDLRVFDLLYGGNLSEAGYDSLKDLNVKTVAVQVPKALIAGGGNVADNPVVGVWSTTERPSVRTLTATNALPGTSQTRSSDGVTDTGDFVQVSRLGNPLVNEAVLPTNVKDYFNRSTPDQDANPERPAALGRVQDPEVPRLIEAIYDIPNPNRTTKGKDRPDLVATFLTGISKKTFPDAGADLNGIDLNKNTAGVPSEQLRLNLSVPPAAEPNRLGVIGGDVAGFPNGRRLGDDVVDVALRVLEGLLVSDQDPAVKKAISGLGDGVDRNDRGFSSTFPYIADPTPGSDPSNGRNPVSFKQNFTSERGQVTTFVSDISPAAPGGLVQLYRINPDGSSTGLGSMRLDATGTRSATKVFPVRRGTSLTLNYRVFTGRTSAAQENRGVPTTFVVR